MPTPYPGSRSFGGQRYFLRALPRGSRGVQTSSGRVFGRYNKTYGVESRFNAAMVVFAPPNLPSNVGVEVSEELKRLFNLMVRFFFSFSIPVGESHSYTYL